MEAGTAGDWQPYANEGRLRRSWRLSGAAWRLVRGSSTMRLLAFLYIAFAAGSTMLVFLFAGYFAPGHHSRDGLALWGLIALYPSVFIGIYINVALAYAASAAFDGEEVSAREALKAASSRAGAIAVWSLISVLVGMLLNQLAQRVPLAGKLIVWLLGVAWGIGTFFVVPVLALERISPTDALRRSMGMAKQRWSEEVGGSLAIGAWTGVIALPAGILFGIGAAVSRTHPGSGVAMMVVGLGGVVVVSALAGATRQVFTVAIYRHAIDAPTGGFSSWDLENPFTGRPKEKRKSWILRICLPILALFFIVGAIAALVGPRHRSAAGYHVTFLTSYAAQLSRDAPVIYQGHMVGYVVDVEPHGETSDVAYYVAPSWRPYVAGENLMLSRWQGRTDLQFYSVP